MEKYTPVVVFAADKTTEETQLERVQWLLICPQRQGDSRRPLIGVVHFVCAHVIL